MFDKLLDLLSAITTAMESMDDDAAGLNPFTVKADLAWCHVAVQASLSGMRNDAPGQLEKDIASRLSDHRSSAPVRAILAICKGANPDRFDALAGRWQGDESHGFQRLYKGRPTLRD